MKECEKELGWLIDYLKSNWTILPALPVTYAVL